MGTSNIYHGRNDRNPLLPEDYVNNENNGNENNDNDNNNNENNGSEGDNNGNDNNENNGNEDNNNESDGNENNDKTPIIPVKWKTVKADMSKYIRSGGTRGNINHIVKQYIKASGGSSKLVSQSTSGIRTGSGLGTFLNDIRKYGVALTFRNLGIEFAGRSVKEVFSQLINILAPISNTKEDIVAKEAAQEALSKVYDYIENNEMAIECLDEMPPVLMNEVLCEYVSSYIWTLVMNDLGSRFEMYLEDPKQTLSIEQEFKDYIFSTVKVEFEAKGDIVNQDVPSAITDLYDKCLKTLEGTL